MIFLYQWFADLIAAPATGANEYIVAACAVALVLCVVVAVKCVFQTIDYMIGGRKK